MLIEAACLGGPDFEAALRRPRPTSFSKYVDLSPGVGW